MTVVDAPPQPPRAAPWAAVGVLFALVLLGGGVRLVALLTDRCLWIDESMLALNLINRSPRQLLDPLDWNQGAPVGFLLAVKGAISAFGASEWALRLVPFAASCAGLVGFAWVARRLLPAHAALLAMALLALSPHLVSYSAECKQYASDAAIAIGLLALAIGLLTSSPSPQRGEGSERSERVRGHVAPPAERSPSPGPVETAGPVGRLDSPAEAPPSPQRGEGQKNLWRWVALAAAGAGAVWCSHPATFILGGIGTALLLQALVAHDRARFGAAALTVGFWLVSFGACYVICLKQLGGNKYLTDYWTEHFMPLPPKSISDLAWIADHLVAFFTMPGGFGGELIPLGGFAAFLALVGLREFARERWPVAVALAGPVAFLLLASGLQKYPFGGRLLLFLIPFSVLLVARGAAAVYDATREKNRFAAVALLVLVVGSAAWLTQDALRRPARQEQLAPVLEKMRPEMKPGDRVYVYYSAVPAFTFYTRDSSLLAAEVTFGAEHRDDPATGYRAELNQLRGRVWVIFSHPHKQEETMLRAMLDSRALCERTIKEKGASAWLYKLE